MVRMLLFENANHDPRCHMFTVILVSGEGLLDFRPTKRTPCRPSDPRQALALGSHRPAVAEPAFPTPAWAGREDLPCCQYVHRGLDQLRLSVKISCDTSC